MGSRCCQGTPQFFLLAALVVMSHTQSHQHKHVNAPFLRNCSPLCLHGTSVLPVMAYIRDRGDVQSYAMEGYAMYE